MRILRAAPERLVKIRVYKGVQVTIQDCIWISGLITGAEVLNLLIRMQDVGANLISPFS